MPEKNNSIRSAVSTQFPRDERTPDRQTDRALHSSAMLMSGNKLHELCTVVYYFEPSLEQASLWIAFCRPSVSPVPAANSTTEEL